MESAQEILAGEKMDIINYLNRQVGTLRHAMQFLLRHEGQRGYCPRCGDRIWYLRHALEPIVTPYNGDGVRHKETCSECFVEEARHE